MIWMILTIIALAFIVWLNIWFGEDKRGIGSSISFGFSSMFMLFLVMFFYTWVLVEIENHQKPIRYETHSQSIYSASRFSGVYGHFILGCGSAESKQYYYYYVKNLNGGFTVNQIEANGVTIYETEEAPSLKYEKKIIKHRKWLIGITNQEEVGLDLNKRLCVPVGTMVEKFEIQ